MKLRYLPALLLLGLAACQKSETPAEPATAAAETAPETTEALTMEEPRAEKRPHEMTLHGVTRVDDYY